MPEVIQLANQVVFTPIALIDSDDLVIMFYSPSKGIVIQSDGYYPVGHDSQWYMGELEAECPWKPFSGTITINFDQGK